MKRFLTIFLLTMFALVMVACGSDDGAKDEGTDSTADGAEDFPSQPIKLIVPLAAGSGTDAVARVIAESVSEYLPNEQSVVVENVTGGATRTGTMEVINADPDGYTLGFNPSGSLTVQPHLGAEYDPDSFQAVSEITSVPLVVYVRDDAPWETFEEWQQYLEENPNTFKFGSSGTGTTSHLLLEMIDDALGTEMVHVPFDGGSEMINALLSDQVDGVAVLEQSAKPHLETGDIRPLFNGGSTKPDSLADVPSLVDQGHDITIDTYMGVIAPKDTPEEIIEILDEAFSKVLEDESVQEKLSNLGNDVVYAGPEEFQQIIVDTYESLGPVLEKIDMD